MTTASTRRVATCFTILSLAAGHLALAQKLPKIKEIQGERVYRVLAKDGIPSIDKPKFVPAEKVKFLRDSDPILGVVRNGVAKAYSIWYLDGHEIVNDLYGEDPVMVTW